MYTMAELILQCIINNQDVSTIQLSSLSINESNYKKQMQKVQTQATEQAKSLKPKNELEQVRPRPADPEQDMIKTPKIIIFSPNGLSYSEVRALRQLDQEYLSQFFFVLGTTQLLKPADYLDIL